MQVEESKTIMKTVLNERINSLYSSITLLINECQSAQDVYLKKNPKIYQDRLNILAQDVETSINGVLALKQDKDSLDNVTNAQIKAFVSYSDTLAEYVGGNASCPPNIKTEDEL